MGTPADVLLRNVRGSLSVGTAAALNMGVRNAMGELPSVVRAMSEAFNQRRLPRQQVKDAHLRIARHAQQAIVDGYHSRLPRGGRSGGALSGSLGSALANPAMTAGTNDQVIAFLNTDVLNSQARHWYRINYGALGPNLSAPGSQEARSFTVNINGRPFLVLRDEHDPSPISYLPRSFFWAGEQLIATRGPARPSSAGARAAHFVDLGLEVVAREFPVEYDQLFRTFIRDAKNRAKLARKGIRVISDIRLEPYGYSVTTR